MCALTDSLNAKIISSQTKRYNCIETENICTTANIIDNKNNDNSKNKLNISNNNDNDKKNYDDNNNYNRKTPKKAQKISSHRNNFINGHDVLQNKLYSDAQRSFNNENNENNSKGQYDNILNKLLTPVSSVAGKVALFRNKDEQEKKSEKKILLSNLRIDIELDGVRSLFKIFSY